MSEAYATAHDPDAFSVVMHFDPMMVAELAMGADDPVAIAERYGLEPDDYQHLAQQEWFGRLVAQKRIEFHDQGVLFTAKAGMMAEALLTRLFQQSMAGSIAAPLTVEVAKQLTDIGRLKPQPLNTQPGAAGGSGFMINIQVNGADVIRSQPSPDYSPTSPSPAAPSVSSTLSGDSAAAAPSAPLVAGDKAAAKGPTLSLDFAPPKGVPPASISNLRPPDFDLRPNPRGMVLPPTSAAAAFGAVSVGLPPPTKQG